MGEGFKRPTVPLDGWASHAKLKSKEQNIKLFQ